MEAVLSTETPRIGTEAARAPDGQGEGRSNAARRDERGHASPWRFPPPVTLRELRQQNDKSLRALAADTGLSVGVLSQIETGRLIATAAEADAIAAALGQPAGALVTRALLVLQEPAS